MHNCAVNAHGAQIAWVMSTEDSPDEKLEIGHVLFIDVVSYSKLLIEEQKVLSRASLRPGWRPEVRGALH